MDLPEVRQCADEESHLFGAIAVKVSENRYGIMHPEHGGSWGTLGNVYGWPLMVPVLEDET